MKFSRKMFISAATGFMAIALAANTMFSPGIIGKTNNIKDSGLAMQYLSQNFNTAGVTQTVAHGITKNADGTFDFTIDGVTYKNEYERLLAEDGFIYGIDYNRFGTYAQYAQGLGFNEITGKKSVYKPEYVERSLYNLKALGFTAINSWILGGGSGYTYDENGLVTGLGDKFVEELTCLLESCRRTGMDIVPTILVHGWGALFNYEYNGLTPYEIRIKYSRYYYDEVARQAYINNGVSKVCEILKEYQDVIPIVNLTVENGTLTNDIENGMLYAEDGVKWKDFAALLNALHETSKEYMPDIPTSVEDVGWDINGFKYNDLKVDIIGHNYYSVKGKPTIENRFQQRPAYLGEMNVGESSNVNQYSDEVLNKARVGHYRNAVEAGYIGGFFFCVHSMAPGRNSNLFSEYRLDDYSLLQNYALDISYTINDLKNEYKGITPIMDKPVMLYNFDSDTNYWVGGRGVNYFILERSDNGGKWKVIADNIDSMNNAMDNGLIKWADNTRVAGVKYRYRVTAVDYSGNRMTSEPTNENEVYVPVEMFVDANGNYNGGFEDGGYKLTYDEANKLENSNGWYVHVDDKGNPNNCGEFTTEEAHSGKYSFKVDYENGIGTVGQYTSFMVYNLKLEPSRTYHFGMWYKTKRGSTSITVRPAGSNENLAYTGLTDTEEEDFDWHYTEVDFTAPDDGLVRIVIMNTSKTVNDTKFYIDDMTITEFR